MDVSNAILKSFCKICSRLYREEKGASAIEYILIAAVVVAAVTTFTGELKPVLSAANESFKAAVSGATPGG